MKGLVVHQSRLTGSSTPGPITMNIMKGLPIIIINNKLEEETISGSIHRKEWVKPITMVTCRLNLTIIINRTITRPHLPIIRLHPLITQLHPLITSPIKALMKPHLLLLPFLNLLYHGILLLGNQCLKPCPLEVVTGRSGLDTLSQ